MATEILPVADTKVNSADITFDKDTAVWISGSRALDVEIGISLKASNNSYDGVGFLGNGNWSGLLPAGTYRFSRISGKAGLQHA